MKNPKTPKPTIAATATIYLKNEADLVSFLECLDDGNGRLRWHVALNVDPKKINEDSVYEKFQTKNNA